MDTTALTAKFARIGARVRFVPATRWETRPAILNIRTDRQGELFEVTHQGDPDLSTLDVRPADRHLLLLLRTDAKQKFLCGHDERHWFVAGVPEAAPVGTVRQAMDALKPPEVRMAVGRQKLDAVARNSRRNAAFVRQGEWFFLPASEVSVPADRVFRWEPLRRGGGKPHYVEELARLGGETVHVCSRRPNGLTATEYRALLRSQPAAKAWGWRVMTRDATVFVRGRVRHPDHATITLVGWHRVLMNTEHQSRAMANVAFLD